MSASGVRRSAAREDLEAIVRRVDAAYRKQRHDLPDCEYLDDREITLTVSFPFGEYRKARMWI